IDDMIIQAYRWGVDRVFRSLADRNRLRIVMILQRGPLTVNEISTVLGLTQPNASRHLKALHEAGVLERRGIAGRAWYSLASGDDLVEAVSSLLDDHHSRMQGFARDMAALSRCYEQRKLESMDFFARKAGEWDEVSAGLPDPAGYSAEMAGLLGRGDSVVELGCGTGAMLGFLRGLFGSVIAVDSSREMLDRAMQAVGGEDVDFRLGALEHLPVADSSVDAALAHMVLHHLADPAEVFPEVRRILRPSGRLVIADLARHADEPFRIAQGDLWPGFEAGEIDAWARKGGLVPVRGSGPSTVDDGVLMMLFLKGEE
ncbi:MAG TPA: metalloregulator ArsR/SmtB family transcription factor, partial [Candidatus Fermentibacter daniensis]|nr:metalloregulator ArsR/SmtB family transcription factor [Candidatus Fermentibacter daniensis]